MFRSRRTIGQILDYGLSAASQSTIRRAYERPGELPLLNHRAGQKVSGVLISARVRRD